jgi:hypothetical protein
MVAFSYRAPDLLEIGLSLASVHVPVRQTLNHPMLYADLIATNAD